MRRRQSCTCLTHASFTLRRIRITVTVMGDTDMGDTADAGMTGTVIGDLGT